MSLLGYDLRPPVPKRRKFQPKRKPRDLRIAGLFLYGLLVWGVVSLPQKAITAWLVAVLG